MESMMLLDRKEELLRILENGIARIRSGEPDELKTLLVMESITHMMQKEIKEKADAQLDN